MFDYTQNNHFRFGFNGQLYSKKLSHHDSWWAEYGPGVKPAVGSFKQECLRAVDLIHNSTSETVCLLLSGGIDSEVMLRSFVEDGRSFSVLIVQFDDELNAFDTKYALQACSELGVKPVVRNLNILKFLASREAFRLAEVSQCHFPGFVAQMKMSEFSEGMPILGSGDCLLKKHLPEGYIPYVDDYPKSHWYLEEKEAAAGLFRYFMNSEIPAVPTFFQYTPELMLAYLQDPLVAKLVNDQFTHQMDSNHIKLSLYQKHFQLKERPKFTGYELMMPFVEQMARLYKAKSNSSSQVFCTPYEKLVRDLSTAI